MHSSQHKKASDHEGKKVVVVGSCTSGFKLVIIIRGSKLIHLSIELAHDIAADYYEHGVGELILIRTMVKAHSS